MERLSALERSLRLWYGPVSLVIYVAAKHSEKSEYEWQRYISSSTLIFYNLIKTEKVILLYPLNTTDININYFL